MDIFAKPLDTVRPHDPDRAEDLIDELLGVLKKRNALLIPSKSGDMILLCVQDGERWRAIAEMDRLSAHCFMHWRPTAPMLMEAPPS
jgi:hypothetical protein